jgi:hypothetical protein
MRALDEALRALNHWTYWESESQLQAMGRPALGRLLDSLEGKVNLWTGKTEMDGREYEDARQAAVAALAKANMAAVLRAFKTRGWSDISIALSGIGRVPDRRVVPQSGRQLVTYPTACDRRRARGILGYRLARGSALGVLPSRNHLAQC